MSQKTLRLIIAIAIVIGLLAVFSTLSGGIDLGNPGNDDGALTACAHAKHDSLGRCTECGEEVGHDFSVRTGNYEYSGRDAKHNFTLACSGNCGTVDIFNETCTIENNKCKYCGYNPDEVAACEHVEHNLSGFCIECGYDVGHTYFEGYIADYGDTHRITYGCADNCGYGGDQVVGCTYVAGVCKYCGDTVCGHPEHNQDEKATCIYCGTPTGHLYIKTYEEISGNAASHTVHYTCEECSYTTKSTGSHHYGDDYICDECGYTATLD